MDRGELAIARSGYSLRLALRGFRTILQRTMGKKSKNLQPLHPIGPFRDTLEP